MEKLNLIIIDSGVSYTIKNQDQIKGFQFIDEITITEDFEDKTGHGTAIYGIIRKTKEIANIVCIKLDITDDSIGETRLVKLLEYIYNNLYVDIINLSLGINICEDSKELSSICSKLSEKGVILVSAFDNCGVISYPAAFESVIGVVSHPDCFNRDMFYYVEDSIINIAAYGNVQRVHWIDSKVILLSGNSLACAHITTHIARIYHSGITKKNQILKQLKNTARKILNYVPPISHTLGVSSKEQLFTINKAAVIFVNKEIQSLLRFSNILPFEITHIYDIKYSLHIGSSIRKFFSCNQMPDLKIENIENIDWKQFDTLIIGHCKQYAKYIKREDMLHDLIKEALKNEVKIFAFDNLDNIIPMEQNLKNIVQFPQVDSSSLPPNRFGMLYRVSIPVIGVYGTSSKQGKFSLQLEIRKRLLDQHYKVGQIGTEPMSLLFGMDYVYPMGYEGNIFLSENQSVIYLNHLINNLCSEGCEIILTGSQSGSIPYDMGNLSNFTLSIVTFLFGTQPDVLILCINPYDSVEYVKRTIDFLESFSNSFVLALVVFPLDFAKDEPFFNRKTLLNKSDMIRIKNTFLPLKKPVLFLNLEEDIDLLVKLIIEYFCE